jgi:hypothetical protein
MYDVQLRSEGLVEGIVSGHPDMPQFEPLQAKSIIACSRSLEL